MSNEANKVTRSRFEIDERGEIAYLEFDRDSQGWMTIWHTEVPPAMRGRGVAAELAQTAFEYAKQNHLRVDVICPLAADYAAKHPEYQSLIGKQANL
ncbi:MAG: GNAT family N-acetyltransferase [Acidobacteriaceae bacterium]